MNKQIKGLLYFYISDIRHTLMVFWSILLLTLVVSIAFAYYLIRFEDGLMGFGFPFGIYFFCLIIGFMAAKEYIPFAIKMGATRKNILISLGIFFLSLVIVKSVVASTIQELVLLFIDAANITTFQFVHPAMMLDDTWLNRILIDVCIMFFLTAFMFIMGLLFYKYGIAGGGLVAGILAIALLFGIAKGWIYDFIVEVVSQMDMLFFYQMLGIGLLLFLLSFVFVRRFTIEKRR